MKSKKTALILLTILILLLTACGGEDETPTPAPTSTTALAAATNTPIPPTDTPEPTEAPPTETPQPTETPEPTATPTQTPLEQAQAATVRIVVEGSQYLETLVGSGTGILYDSSGLILTSNHLVDGAGLIQVSIEGQEESLTAQIVGRSTCDNIAVLQLLGSKFPTITLSDTDALDSALQIIGYPFNDTTQSTQDSALDDQTIRVSAGFANISDTLQLDTALDSGYSGAPVLTNQGQLTGLIVYPGSESDHAAVLPLSTILPILAQLEARENLDWIGLNAGPISAESAQSLGIHNTPGLFVYAVDFRGPGGQADVRNGDVITEIGGIDLTGEDSYQQYCQQLRQTPTGDPLDIVVIRNGSRYLGQINGDPLTEEVVVVEAPPEEEPNLGENPTPSGDAKAALLVAIQSTQFEIRSIGGRIDSLATNGCLTPILLAGSTNDGPVPTAPEGDPLAHPGCIHSITDCEDIIARYGRITTPITVGLTNADQELIDAHNSYQSAVAAFIESATNLVEACRAFIADPNLTIGPFAFGLARQGVDNALTILNPLIEQLQGA